MKNEFRLPLYSNLSAGTVRLSDHLLHECADIALTEVLHGRAADATAVRVPVDLGIPILPNSFAFEVTGIVDGALRKMPPSVDEAGNWALRRFNDWERTISVSAASADAALSTWWTNGPRTGPDAIRRLQAVRATQERFMRAREDEITAAEQAAQSAASQIDRERLVIDAAVSALQQAPGRMSINLNSPEAQAAVWGGVASLVSILGGEPLSAVALTAVGVGAAAWGWSRFGRVLLGRYQRTVTRPNPVEPITRRLAAAFEGTWSKRAESVLARARMQAAADAVARFAERRDIANLWQLSMVPLDPADATGKGGAVQFVELHAGEVIVDANSLAAQIASSPGMGASLRSAVASAIEEASARGASDRGALLKAIVARLPEPSISSVITLAIQDPATRDRFVGHLRALASAMSSAAGNVRPDVLPDPGLSPRTLSIALPDGPADPLAGLVRSTFANAAILKSSDRSQIEVIVDAQNVRFDHLQLATELRDAYDRTSAVERALWHFPALEAAPAAEMRREPWPTWKNKTPLVENAALDVANS